MQGAIHALVSNMSDGSARPMIQYGKSPPLEPGGKCPTGSTIQPPRNTMSTATAGLQNRNTASAEAANTRSATTTFMPIAPRRRDPEAA